MERASEQRLTRRANNCTYTCVVYETERGGERERERNGLDGEPVDAVVVPRRRRRRETLDDLVEELEDVRLEVVVVDQGDQEIRVVDLHGG